MLWQIDVEIAGKTKISRQLIKNKRLGNVKLDKALININLKSRQLF